MKIPLILPFLILITAPVTLAQRDGPGIISVSEYASIQAAIDANPGRMIFIPSGDHFLSEALEIRKSKTGLYGFGKLIQRNPKAAIIHIREASDVTLRGLILTRAEGTENTRESAVRADNCARLTIEKLHITGNRSPAPSIALDRCDGSEVVRSRIENYMTLSIDDRLDSSHYGYAFNCIDGTGLAVRRSRIVLLDGNHIIEHELRPTPELKKRHKLGGFVERAAAKGSLVGQKTWDAGYVNNWHQGSALLVTSPEETEHVHITGNVIENGAQGIDIHADFVTISGNQVINCFMGMKAMHGSRNVLITNNQFTKNDIWSIGLMPGANSSSKNPDGGHVISNNIITDFGRGDSAWIWGTGNHTTAPIFFDQGQEPDDPPLTKVVVTGNLIYDLEREKDAKPKYDFAVRIHEGDRGPRDLHFHGNSFQSGREGIANQNLKR